MLRRRCAKSDMIISLYAGGMTIRDIQAHLERTLGTELSHETISNITEAVAEEVKAWQTRPLELVYPHPGLARPDRRGCRNPHRG